MKHHVRILIYIVCLIALSICCIPIYDYYQKIELQRITLSKLQTKNDIKKYSRNKITYLNLKDSNLKSLQFESDNQTSGNMKYYIVKIDHKYYGITFIQENNSTKLSNIVLIKK